MQSSFFPESRPFIQPVKTLIAIAFLGCAFCVKVQGGGVILYTSGGSSYVNLVEYAQISSPAAHINNLTLKNGSRFQVRTDSIISNIPFPYSKDAKDPQNIPALISEIEMLTIKHPQYAPFLIGVGRLWEKVLMEQEKNKIAQLVQEKAKEQEKVQLDATQEQLRINQQKQLEDKQRALDEYRRKLVQVHSECLLSITASVSEIIKARTLTRKALAEHLGLNDNKTCSQWIAERFTKYPPPETGRDFLDLLNNEMASLESSASTLFLVIDQSELHLVSKALNALDVLISEISIPVSPSTSNADLFEHLHVYLNEKISESNLLRASAEKLFNDKKYKAALGLYIKASSIDERDGDADLIKRCTDAERSDALDSLGI